MPVTGKGIGQAWFYHAPAKPSISERVPAPPMSQIPDLTGYTGYREEEPQRQSRNIIYETDSNYIRLAKQGGRHDLLAMMPKDGGPSLEPVGYPRCDWYYDSFAPARNNSENYNNEPYSFKLPAYMVHPEPVPRQSTDGYVKISDHGPPTIHIVTEPSNQTNGNCNKNNNKKTVWRPVAKKKEKIEPNPPCKPPADHLGPNGIHKY